MYKFGVDVEFFLIRGENGFKKWVPAHTIVPASKSDPATIEMPDGEWKYHWDNASLEVASPIYKATTITCKEVLGRAVHTAKMVLAELGASDVALSFKGAITIPEDWSSKYPEVNIFGCAPEYDAYTAEERIPPLPTSTIRASGLHIHFSFDDPKKAGFDPSNREHYLALCKAFDVFVGCHASKIGALSKQRMELYGGPGAFRPKPEYPGIEYRTLDPSIISSDLPIALDKVYEQWWRFLEPGGQLLAEIAANAIRHGRELTSPSVYQFIEEAAEAPLIAQEAS